MEKVIWIHVFYYLIEWQKTIIPMGEKLLVYGIFDCLQIDKGYISLISSKLKGKSKILFEEWKKKQ